MRLPETTAASDEDITLAVFNVSVGGRNVGNVNLGVHLTTITREECLRQVLAALAAQKQELDSKELLDVDGQDAFLLESHGHLEGQDLHFLTLYIIGKKQVIVATCTAPEKQYKTAYPEFQAAIKSVKPGALPAGKDTKSVYINPAYGVTMNLPATSITQGSVAMLASFFASAGDVDIGSIDIQVQLTANTRDKYLPSVLAALASGNMTVDSKELLEVDGRDAFRIESHGHAEGQDLHGLVLFIFDKTRMFMVTCKAPEDKFKSASREFREAIDSVKLAK